MAEEQVGAATGGNASGGTVTSGSGGGTAAVVTASTASGGDSQAGVQPRAPSTPTAAAIQAKAKLQAAGQATATQKAQPTAQEATGQPVEGPATPPASGAAAPDDAEAKLDEWLGSKGVTLGDARKHPEVRKVLDMYRNLESTHTRVSQQLREQEEQVKELLARQQQLAAGAMPEKSPVDALEERYQEAIKTQCMLYGYGSEAEWAQKHPQAYAALRGQFDTLYRKALRDEQLWHLSKQQAEQAKKEADARMAQQLAAARTFMRDNIAEAKKLDPNAETNLIASGAIQFVTELGKVWKVPNEMILATPSFFKFLSAAANAIIAVRNLPKTKEAWKQEYESGLAKAAKAAATPSPLDAMPPDNKVVLAGRLQKRRSANDF